MLRCSTTHGACAFVRRGTKGSRHEAAEASLENIRARRSRRIRRCPGGLAARLADDRSGRHVGARIVSQAAPGEILVSSTVKDLVAGSGLEFADRGDHTLKGVPGESRLFAAT
jgi:hypothetical protein